MQELSRPVWAEGIILGQQHFQQWDRFQEATLALQARALNPLAWGLLSLKIDEKALEGGRFRLRECLAAFPGGRLVAHNAAEDQPLLCELDGRGGDTVEVYLGLPANHRVTGISGYPTPGQLCAWEADYRPVVDEYDASREREVLFARPNLMLMTGTEPRESCITLKLAEVLNEGDGTYRLLTDYIPPVIRIEASAEMQALLLRTVEIAGARLRTLQERRHSFRSPAEFARTEPLHFGQLQVIGEAYPQLLHFQHNPQLHPELLYRTLSRLVGALCAFSSEWTSGDLPPYRHAEPGAVFPTLVRMLEGLVHLADSPTRSCVSLVRESRELLCSGPIDSEHLERERFFLQVEFDSPDPSWITDFTRQVKVGSRESMETIVASALPGVRLVHTQRPPASLKIKSGSEYFRLEPKGDFWDRIRMEQNLAVFLSRNFVEAAVELIAVEEG